MAGEGRKQLERELAAALPPALGVLDDPELADLAGAIGEAKRRQTAALARAADSALEHIPRVLRGPVRAVFR